MSQDMNIKFWKYIRANKKHIDNSCIIKDGDIVYDAPESQLKMWRTQYYNVLNESIDEAQDYDNDFKYVVESEVEQLNNYMSKDDSPAGINLTPFTLDEVTSICNNLPNGKAPGADLFIIWTL